MYDRPLTIYTLTSGSPLLGKLEQPRQYYCREMEVYHRRYWEAMQAGCQIDKVVRVPMGGEITATMYAIPQDGHVYRIEQAQHGEDEDGFAVTTLSLRRMEGRYDIAGA